MSLLLQGRPREALPELERAVSIRSSRASSDSDADMGTLLALVAQAHVFLLNLQQADEFYGKSVATFERAIVALPSSRDDYAESLEFVLRLSADVKRARGLPEEARALDEKAAATRTFSPGRSRAPSAQVTTPLTSFSKKVLHWTARSSTSA